MTVRNSVPVIVATDQVELHSPVCQYHPVSFPDTHATVINMVGFSTTTIEFQNKKILSFLSGPQWKLFLCHTGHSKICPYNGLVDQHTF
jgi:hypothetical protein